MQTKFSSTLYLFLFGIFMVSTLKAQESTVITGVIIDAETGQPLLGVNDDYYIGQWKIEFIDTPQGNILRHVKIVISNGQLTGILTDPTGQSDPIPITKIEEKEGGIIIYFTAQGMDVDADLKKVDDTHLKGLLMNMFVTTMIRMRDGVLLNPNTHLNSPSKQQVTDTLDNMPKAFGTDVSQYYGATWNPDIYTNSKVSKKWFPKYDFDAHQFAIAPREFGPSTRWWWPGNHVTNDELKREVKLFADNGFAGVEIQPFAAALNMRAEKESIERIYSWDTPSFYEHLKTVMEQAKISGIVVDLNAGSGWSMGGSYFDPKVSLCTLGVVDSILLSGSNYDGKIPMLKIKESGLSGNTVNPDWGIMQSVIAAKILQTSEKQLVLDKNSIINLTDIVEDNKLTWQVPTETDWRLIVTWSIPTGETPVIIAKKGANYVVDFLDASIVTNSYEYLFGERVGLEEYYGNPFRAVFNDSYEFHVNRMVSPDIKKLFKKLNSYDITPYMATIFKKGYNHPTFLSIAYQNDPIPYTIDNENHWRLMYDYDLAVNEVFKTILLKLVINGCENVVCCIVHKHMVFH